jgi:hypothetical protein
MSLETAFQKLRSLTDQPHPVKTGTVKAVNLKNLTCDVDPDDEGAEIPGVLLRAVEVNGAATGFTVIPAKGAKVVVLMLDEDTAALVQASSAQLLTVATENESLKAILKDTFTAIGRMKFLTASGGPTVQLVNATEFSNLSSRLDNLLHE